MALEIKVAIVEEASLGTGIFATGGVVINKECVTTVDPVEIDTGEND